MLLPARVRVFTVLLGPIAEHNASISAAVKPLWSKSIAAEAGNPAGYVLGHPSWEALGPSEEHLPFACHDLGDKPRVGDLAFVVPEHVCPTVNLATHAVVLDRGEDGERVVSVHEVKARGHELFVGARGHELFVNRG